MDVSVFIRSLEEWMYLTKRRPANSVASVLKRHTGVDYRGCSKKIMAEQWVEKLPSKLLRTVAEEVSKIPQDTFERRDQRREERERDKKEDFLLLRLVDSYEQSGGLPPHLEEDSGIIRGAFSKLTKKKERARIALEDARRKFEYHSRRLCCIRDLLIEISPDLFEEEDNG